MSIITNLQPKGLKAKQGFTLIELAIVIVIIGFLVAGISVGNNLIQEARLKSIIEDFTNYQIIYTNFKTRYRSVPGDMRTASAYWSNCAVTNINCNGDGNGIIDYNNHNTGLGDATGDETVRVWRHLHLAELINGDGGTSILINLYDAVGQRTSPWFPSCTRLKDCFFEMAGPSKGWFGIIYGGFAGPNIYFSPWYDEGRNANFILNSTNNGVLTPEHALAIDIKTDDGNVQDGILSGATTGRIRAMNDNSGANCLDGSNNYDTTHDNKICILGSQLD